MVGERSLLHLLDQAVRWALRATTTAATTTTTNTTTTNTTATATATATGTGPATGTGATNAHHHHHHRPNPFRYEHIYMIDKTAHVWSYTLDQTTKDLCCVVLIGMIYRIIAYIAMISFNKEKQS